MTNIGGLISVIGAGTMGNGIAHVFAQNGFKVNLIDISLAQLETALGQIAKNFDRQIAKGTATEEQKKCFTNFNAHAEFNARLPGWQGL